MQKQTSPFFKIIPLFAVFALLACQLDALMQATAPTATSTRAATATRAPTLTPPIAMLVSPTQPPAPTDTPAPIVATITTNNLRVRSAPSTSGAIVDKLNTNDKIQVVGKNVAGDWLQIPLPSNPDARGWISAQYAQLSGPLDLIPVVGPGAPPTSRPYP
ncbi:MAG: SH3 domain-containing protein [Chloroflexi bacterium]|nr:SH3 domain-containing protein [Chloroflexota bacterium]